MLGGWKESGWCVAEDAAGGIGEKKNGILKETDGKMEKYRRGKEGRGWQAGSRWWVGGWKGEMGRMGQRQ